MNAIMLVNAEKESVVSNARVQECLGKTRAVRKPIVRYIQVCPFYSAVCFVFLMLEFSL